MSAEPRVLARFTGYGGLLDALRARLDDKHIPHAVFDDICGIADGLTNKILKPVPIRYLLPNTLGDFVEAAGCVLWLVEDPELNAKLERRLDGSGTDAWPRRRRELHRDSASPVQVAKLTPLVAREMGRKGNAKRWTPEVRRATHTSEMARYAAFCRWRISMRWHKKQIKSPSSPA